MEFLRPHLDAYAVTLNRFAPEDRIHTVGASDVGQCERKVYWTKNLGDPDYGAPVDDDYVDSYGAKLRGTVMENVFWAPGLKAAFGERLLFAGEDQKTFVSGYLSATPDGMIAQLTMEERVLILRSADEEGVGTEVMVECKTYDPRTNLADPKTENVFQTHVQMGLVRELTQYKPTHSILSYTDASWWNEGKEFVIAFDASIYANAKKRAERIMTATSAEQLQPEGWIGGGRDCEYCPFTRPCGVERRRVPDAAALAALPADLVAEVTKLARAIKQIDSAIDTESAVMRDLQDRLKTVLRNASVRKVPGVVSWSSVKGKSGWDNKSIREAAIEAGVDISAYATEGEPSDRLQITLKTDPGRIVPPHGSGPDNV
jgi:hypothetical protein